MKLNLIFIASLLVFATCRFSAEHKQEINDSLKKYNGDQLIKIAETNERIVRYLNKQFLVGSIKERMEHELLGKQRSILIEQIEENPKLLNVVSAELAFCDEAAFTKTLAKEDRSLIDNIALFVEEYNEFFNKNSVSAYNEIKKLLSQDSAINYILSYAQDYPELCIFGRPESTLTKLW